ncbi:MAG: TIGR04211 family SH3 domain-containing protein [Gammaproteobacteria bacterium]|nr:MAG: TIGR04211 family SH3 domain-containing protein [Gammaproteobacteria bacterium]
MKGLSRPCALATFLWLVLLTAPASAETVYVADRFEIGVHDNTNIDSAIVAVIPSGTPLTVIDRDGEFVKVSTPDGVRGWVDTRYVVSDKPSITLLEERDTKLRDTLLSLRVARGEVEVLRQRVIELQRDAATAARNSPGITKSVSLVANENASKLKDTERELENLAKVNRQLKIHIADLQAIQIASAKSAVESTLTEKEDGEESIWYGPASNDARTWTPWQWLLFGSILLLAFAAGGYAVDWESRRRHGGFRV